MKRLIPVPNGCAEHLKKSEETGIGYHAISVKLKDGRVFDQVIASEGFIIEVRGYSQIPFAADEVESISISHTKWNFRENADVRVKARAAGA
jgi:hypothetical protein